MSSLLRRAASVPLPASADLAAPLGALLALSACLFVLVDRWCPVPRAAGEVAVVVVLLLFPLAWQFRYPAAQPASSDWPKPPVGAGAEREEAGGLAGSSEDALTPQGAPRRLATASLDGTVRLWGFVSGQCERKLVDHNGALSAVTFSADGTTLATGAFDGTARLWDAETGHCKHVFDDCGGAVCSVALSPCGGSLLTGLDDHCAQLWRVPEAGGAEPAQPELVLEGHEGAVASVAFSPCGAVLATGSWDTTARLWNRASGTCDRVLEGHSAEVFAVAFDPYGDLVATGSQDGTARLWNVAAGWCLMTLDAQETAVRSLAFSGCGRLLATGCWDGGVKLWDVDSGACRSTFRSGAEAGPVHALAFSADGSSLATVDGDEARLWKAASGQCFQVFKGHTDRVQAVAVSP